ncbi:MAG TPA: PA2169 family four-helix-bundle protein [Paracoccaceae bacterium]|nr:PA2169 family four-helix-bundle protein [Paracoccaceae bacterium]HMO72065.1 PA2169 family four-helix-bundle protein [Paracoccaceae bacterium]
MMHPAIAPGALGVTPDEADPTGITAPDLGPLYAAHGRTLDALAGFETMVEKAEPHFRPVAERFAGLHRRHGGELGLMLAELGGTPDGDGTLMGTVNKAVVSLRAFFGEIDEDAMDSIRSGEQHVCTAYQEALASDLPAPIQMRIAALLAELNDLLAETRSIG